MSSATELISKIERRNGGSINDLRDEILEALRSIPSPDFLFNARLDWFEKYPGVVRPEVEARFESILRKVREARSIGPANR